MGDLFIVVFLKTESERSLLSKFKSPPGSLFWRGPFCMRMQNLFRSRKLDFFCSSTTTNSVFEALLNCRYFIKALGNSVDLKIFRALPKMESVFNFSRRRFCILSPDRTKRCFSLIPTRSLRFFEHFFNVCQYSYWPCLANILDLLWLKCHLNALVWLRCQSG